MTGVGPMTGVELATAQAVTDFGRALATVLRAGDLVVLTGDLGAGKTTLTQGLGKGLGVRGPITSPTFVIARVHPSLRSGPALVHVDAYRLGSLDELEDMDLDATIEAAVTVVEWGEGLVEQLTESHLHVTLVADPVTEVRRLRIEALGPRWSGPATRAVLAALVSNPLGGED